MRQLLYEVVHGFMLWNLFLAAVPVVLAVVLFRPGTEHTPLWWVCTGMWVLFLPNAPYLLTDVVHMVDDVQAARDSNPRAYAIVALYAAFFAVGVACYTISLSLLERHLVPRLRARYVVLTLLGLHAACAVALYLGRFLRANSWDVLLDPSTPASWPAELARRPALVTIAGLFMILTVAWFVMRAVLIELAGDARRVARRYLR